MFRCLDRLMIGLLRRQAVSAAVVEITEYDLRESGAASTTRDRPQIELTPAMIEAGIDALRKFADPQESWSQLRRMAIAAFEAMLCAVEPAAGGPVSSDQELRSDRGAPQLAAVGETGPEIVAPRRGAGQVPHIIPGASDCGPWITLPKDQWLYSRVMSGRLGVMRQTFNGWEHWKFYDLSDLPNDHVPASDLEFVLAAPQDGRSVDMAEAKKLRAGHDPVRMLHRPGVDEPLEGDD